MDGFENELTPIKKYQHLWILVLLPMLYCLSNQDRVRFGYLSRHLFNQKLETQSDNKNVSIDKAFLLNTDDYDQIVRGGKKYLPFVILKLQMDRVFIWSEMMRDITGVDIHQYARDRRWLDFYDDPTPLWLKWWQENKSRY